MMYIAETASTPKQFLSTLLQICPPGKRPLYCEFSQPPAKGQWAASKITKIKLNGLCRLSNKNRYITVSVFEDDRRRKSDFVAMVAIMVDDPGTKVPFENIALPPTYWVETSPGNYQAWYFLSEPITDREYAESIVNAMIAQGLSKDGSDPGMKGVTRYGRLPGGWNNKESLKTPHRVTAYEDTRGCNYYTAEEIIDAYDLDLDAVGHLSGGSIEGSIDQIDRLVVTHDPIYKIFEKADLIKYQNGEKIEVTCPWVDTHTDGVDNGTALLIQPGGGLGFQCHHGHCEHKTLKDIHTWAKKTYRRDYNEYYSVKKESKQPDPKTIKDVINKLLIDGTSNSSIDAVIPDIASDFGVSTYDVRQLIRSLQDELLQNEEIERLNLDELASLTETVIELTEVFPLPLAKAIQSKCDSDKLHPFRPIQSLLPMFSALLGTMFHILVKSGIGDDDDWVEYPPISCIDIGPPSTGKTQTNVSVTKPLAKQEEQRINKYYKELELYNQCVAIARMQNSELPEEPEEPYSLYVTGGTPEGIMKKISELPPKHGMFYIKDEISSLISSSNQYKSGKGGDFLDTLLSAMSQPLKGTSVRSSKENQLFPFQRQTICIAGSTQPNRLKLLFDPNDDASGLASRFLCAFPELPDDFDQFDLTTKVSLQPELEKLVSYLQSIGNPDKEIRCVMDRSTHQKYLKRLRGFRRTQMDTHEKNISLSGFIGKCPKHLASLILVSHCIASFYEEESLGDISTISFNRASYLMDRYIGQFRRIQVLVSGPENLSKIQLYIYERLKKSIKPLSVDQVYKAIRMKKDSGFRGQSKDQIRTMFEYMHNNKYGVYDPENGTLTNIE